MPAPSQDAAVRNYLISLKDPSALRDEETLKDLREQLEKADDELERLQVRQQILDLEQPGVQRYEEEFITHARAWAEEHGVTERAFAAEGVPANVLRKAGFRKARGRATTQRRGGGVRRTRVSADQIRSAIPKGTFTIKDLQERSGASSAVVRRVVQEELQAGNLVDKGTDTSHSGPGRAPTVYQRK